MRGRDQGWAPLLRAGRLGVAELPMPLQTTPALAAQLGRFMISTGFSAAMSFGLPILLHEWFGIAERIAVAIGFATAYAGNIVLLRLFVFRSRGSWRKQLARYIPANGAFRLAEYVAFLLLLERAGLDYRIAMLVVLGASACFKFFVYRWIFVDRSGQGQPAP